MSKRGPGQRIRRKIARARPMHRLERLERQWEAADPEDADIIAEEADALARKVCPFSKLPGRRKEVSLG